MSLWRELDCLIPECQNCPSLPICGGECRQITYTDYLDNSSEIKHFERLLTSISDEQLHFLFLEYNIKTKIRNESFGYCIHINGNDYLVDSSFLNIHSYFIGKGVFSINQITEDFEDKSELLYLIKNLIKMNYLIISHIEWLNILNRISSLNQRLSR